MPISPKDILAAGVLGTALLTLTGCPWDDPPKPETLQGAPQPQASQGAPGGAARGPSL